MSPRAFRGVSPIDVIAGLCVVALCAIFAWVAAGYGIGEPRRMGPGFFPFGLGVIGMALGASIVARAVLAPRPKPRPLRLRRLLFIVAAFVVFALMIEPAGLLLTIVVTTMLGAMADPESRPLESLALGIGLALGIWIVFVQLLELGVPVLPGER